MDISIWVIIIAGGGVLISMAALGFTIYWNIRQEMRTREFNNSIELREQQRLILEQRRQEIEEQRFSQEQQRQRLEQQEQQIEQERSRPYLYLHWGSWTGLRDATGWFESGELTVENISEVPIVSVKMAFSHGDFNAQISNPIQALRIGESRRISIRFDRPRSFYDSAKPAPSLVCEAVLTNSLRQRFENTYEWNPSSHNPNFNLMGSRILEG